MKIYFMRHGMTAWNEKGIIQGANKVRLTKAGISEAEMVAEKYADLELDLIISSPHMRTIQTANIMNRFHKCCVLKDERIREIGQGVFAGRKKSSLSCEEIKARRAGDKSYGLETLEELYLRVIDFINDVKKKYSDKNILVVTHGAVLNCIESIIEHKVFDCEKFSHWKKYNNCQILYLDV